MRQKTPDDECQGLQFWGRGDFQIMIATARAVWMVFIFWLIAERLTPSVAIAAAKDSQRKSMRVGWAFIAQGVLNFITGPFKFNSLAGVLVVCLPILQVVPLFAYGYFIYQQSVKPPIASESKTPLA